MACAICIAMVSIVTAGHSEWLGTTTMAPEATKGGATNEKSDLSSARQ